MGKFKYLIAIVLIIACVGFWWWSSNQVPDYVSRINDLSNEELIAEFKLAHLEYIANINSSFVFESPSDLSTDALYKFFIERIDALDPDYKLRKAWHDSEDNNNLHIPISEIQNVLSKYLLKYNFDAKKLKSYNAEKNEIVTPTITGWGGGYTAKIKNKELKKDELTLEVEYYSENNTYQHTKIYKILIEEKGYKFLAVSKKD